MRTVIKTILTLLTLVSIGLIFGFLVLPKVMVKKVKKKDDEEKEVEEFCDSCE